LSGYVERFGSVELNASFYRWPRDATFAGWRRRLPAGFQMSVKDRPPFSMEGHLSFLCRG
jgi:uncharacterized protein YecE (DUF72 family)